MSSQRIDKIKKIWPDFEVTEADMKKPTTGFVMLFFEKTVEEIALLDFTLMDHSDRLLNQVSTLEGGRIVVFCTLMRYIFARTKGPPFGIEDIIEPDARRFEKQVDILLNLCGYLDFYFCKVCTAVMDDVDRILKLKEELLQEIDEGTERRNQIALESRALSIDIKLKMEEKEKYAAILNKVKGKNSEVVAEYDKHKAIHEKLTAEISGLEEAVQKENEEIEAIKENIILSPDAVSLEKVELMNRRKELMEKHAAIKTTAEEKKQYASQLEQLCSKMMTAPALIGDLIKNQSFLKHLEKGFHEDHVYYMKAEEKYNTLVKDYESTKEERSKIIEEMKKMEEQHFAKIASLENDILEENQRLQEAEQEHIKKGAEEVLTAQQIQIFKENIASVDHQMKMLGEHRHEKKRQMENEVDQIHQRIQLKASQMEKTLGIQFST